MKLEVKLLSLGPWTYKNYAELHIISFSISRDSILQTLPLIWLSIVA